MIKEKLYLAWQDPKNRNWWPVGMLTYDDNNTYRFFYTKGAKELTDMGIFEPFARMKKLDAVYKSGDLFPLFTNRILSDSRPEYKRHLDWLGSTVEGNKRLSILAMTEGIRGTDTLEVFRCPKENAKGEYEVVFLAHGLRYLTKSAINRLNNLHKVDQLYLIFDMQNAYDKTAMALRTDDPVEIVGYCPRYLSPDFLALLKEYGTNNVKVSVERINAEAPLNLRLVCKIVSPWPVDNVPCSDEKYQPIVENLSEEIQKASKTLAVFNKSLTSQSREDSKSVTSYDNINSNSKSQKVRSITSSKDEYKKGGK